MLKSTDNTFSREQFVMLRKARALITEQFQDEFSLHSDHVVADVYAYAVRSESNELFRLFTDLNELSGGVVEQPLNEEQFILLREAKHLIDGEFKEELGLVEKDVMDQLFDFSLRSDTEALYDIFRYLISRNGESDDPRSSGSYFLASKEGREVVDEVDQSVPVATELVFAELSAPDFERLRGAKAAIQDEFTDGLSLHRTSTLDDLYDFAVKSTEPELFDLFCDLRVAQLQSRSDAVPPKDWMGIEQYRVLCEAREAIQLEFDTTIELRSPRIQAELYEFSLRAEEESLFAYCRDFHDLCDPEDRAIALPSKEEFKLLRHARALVAEEFAEDLALDAGVVEYDLYLYAVRSDRDELFDLYSHLMDLPDKLATTAFDDVELLLSKGEYLALRNARRLVRDEFDAHLALESESVLDELYRFALDSESEDLFDIHANLNAEAIDAEPAKKVTEPSEPEPDVPVLNEISSDLADEASPTEEPKPDEAAGIGRFFRFFSSKGPEVATPSNETSDEENSATLDEAPEETPEENTEEEPKAEQKMELDIILPEPEVEEIDIDPPVLEGEDEPKLDMITRAMMQKKGASSSDEKKSTPPQEEKKPDRTKSKLNVSLPPLASAPIHSDQDWYVATSDDQFRLRIINEINLSPDGELLLVIDDSEPVGALITIEETGPVLVAKVDGLLVNGEPPEDRHLLEDGDQISFGAKELRLEASSESKAASSL